MIPPEVTDQLETTMITAPVDAIVTTLRRKTTAIATLSIVDHALKHATRGALRVTTTTVTTNAVTKTMDTVADILAATIIVAPEVDLERTTRVDVVAVVTAVM